MTVGGLSVCTGVVDSGVMTEVTLVDSGEELTVDMLDSVVASAVIVDVDKVSV